MEDKNKNNSKRTNNPNGRPRGAKNKITRPLKESISNFLTKNWSKIQSDINKLEPFQRVQIYERLLQYSLPRLKSIDATLEVERKLESLSDEKLNELIDQILKD